MMKQSLDVLIMFHISIHYITDVDIILQKYFELDYLFWLCYFSQPYRNLPPITCRYWPNRLFIGSLWNLDVMMKSYPSKSKSFVSEARHFNALTNAGAICEVRVNFSKFEIFFRLINSWCNLPWSVRMMVSYLQLQLHFLDNFELDKTHHLLNSIRKAAALAFSGKFDFTAAIVVSSNIARAFGTFCLQLPGCKTFVVTFGAFLMLTCKFASLSKTWKVLHAISPPETLIGSLNPEN